MTEDYFWGMTLDDKRTSETWDPDRVSDPNESAGLRGEHTLLVKQIVLGPDAKEGEVNVVEVEAMGYRQDMKFPIAVMKKGAGAYQSVLDLLFPDPPVTFKLTKGNGPVHLLGNHSVGSGELGADDDEDDELDEELDDEDLDDLEEAAERNNIEEKKRKLNQTNSNSKQKAKKAKADDEK